MNRKTKIRCAIYTRKSSEDGLDLEFNSLDAQREAGEAFIASQKAEGWFCLPQRYDDGGFSGGNVERPALQHLLADIEAGQVDCVVVYKVDRLSRSLLDFARIMGVFDDRNISFVSVTQQFNTTHSMGRLTLNILLSFAQFEREIIGERIRDKLAAQCRKGKWTGGIPVLGYEVDRSGPSPKLIINPDEATQVRQIFQLYLQFGALLPVVEALSERNWTNKAWTTKNGKPRGGRPFERNSLYALLTNPLYAGKIRHRDDLYEGEHEAIVDPDLYHRVQSLLQRNGRQGGVVARNKHGALLRQLLVCKACDRVMTHTFTNNGSRRYRYYTCSGAIQRGRQTCPSPSLPAEEIENAVIEQIHGLAEDAGLRGEVLKQGRSQVEGELRALQQEVADYERARKYHQREIRKLTTGEQTGDAIGLLADHQDRLLSADRRLTDLRRQVEQAEAATLTRSEVNAAFRQFEAVWNLLSPREQAQLLSLLIARVEFDPDDTSIAVTFHATGLRTLVDDQEGGSPC